MHLVMVVHQHRHILPHQFTSRIAKQGFGRFIDFRYDTQFIDGHDRVACRRQDGAHTLLLFLEAGRHVIDGAQENTDFVFSVFTINFKAVYRRSERKLMGSFRQADERLDKLSNQNESNEAADQSQKQSEQDNLVLHFPVLRQKLPHGGERSRPRESAFCLSNQSSSASRGQHSHHCVC